MKKKSLILILLLSCIFLFTGCPSNRDAWFDRLVVNGINVSGNSHTYVVTSNLDEVRAYIGITDNVKSFKLTQREIDSNGNYTNNDKTYKCYDVKSSNPYEDLTNLRLGYKYSLNFQVYSNKGCNTSNDSMVMATILTYQEESPSESYISVENIKSKLDGWTYTNTSGGSEIPCSYYGIEDKEKNIPLCIALARVNASASDCADFLRTVYVKATGVRPSIYSRGSQLGSAYTNKVAQVPTGLKDGDLITLWNGDCSDCYAHIGIVFYWDAAGGWHVVNGGMSGKVKLYTLQETLDKSNTWTKYIYRSQ